MKKTLNFELIFFALLCVLYFFVKEKVIFNSFYVVIALLFSFYLFPIKFLFKREEKTLMHIISYVYLTIVISFSIMRLYVEFNLFFKIVMLIFNLFNYYLIYYYNKQNSNLKYLFVLNLFLLPQVYFP